MGILDELLDELTRELDSAQKKLQEAKDKITRRDEALRLQSYKDKVLEQLKGYEKRPIFSSDAPEELQRNWELYKRIGQKVHAAIANIPSINTYDVPNLEDRVQVLQELIKLTEEEISKSTPEVTA